MQLRLALRVKHKTVSATRDTHGFQTYKGARLHSWRSLRMLSIVHFILHKCKRDSGSYWNFQHCSHKVAWPHLFHLSTRLLERLNGIPRPSKQGTIRSIMSLTLLIRSYETSSLKLEASLKRQHGYGLQSGLECVGWKWSGESARPHSSMRWFMVDVM